MELRISDAAKDVVRKKGGKAAIDFIAPIGWGGSYEVSVDTYLKGKNTGSYKRVFDDDLEIMVSPKLLQYANIVELVAKKKLLGSKLDVIAHHEHGPNCNH